MSTISSQAGSSNPRFSRFAWAVVGYNLLVILWGAWVRITGSGAGCGSHWPTCNGEVIPRAERIETIIEMVHRLTSGVSLPLTIAVVIWAFKAFEKGSRVRSAAVVSGIFLLLEAALGALLVIFELVDKDDSVARAVVVALHLLNTFTLVAAGALTAWWGGGGAIPRWRGARGRGVIMAAVAGLLITSMAGAITALGDTIFPIDPEVGGGLFDRIHGDLSTGEHFLIRLRAIHPFIAVFVGVGLLGWTMALRWRDERDPVVVRWSLAVSALVLIELTAGVINIMLAAPGWMQLVHLLLANLLWISLTVLGSAHIVATAGAASATGAQGA